MRYVGLEKRSRNTTSVSSFSVNWEQCRALFFKRLQSLIQLRIVIELLQNQALGKVPQFCVGCVEQEWDCKHSDKTIEQSNEEHAAMFEGQKAAHQNGGKNSQDNIDPDRDDVLVFRRCVHLTQLAKIIIVDGVQADAFNANLRIAGLLLPVDHAVEKSQQDHLKGERKVHITMERMVSVLRWIFKDCIKDLALTQCQWD